MATPIDIALGVPSSRVRLARMRSLPPQSSRVLPTPEGGVSWPLHEASQLVRPGGRLVYATCSLLRAENGCVAEAFEVGLLPTVLA